MKLITSGCCSLLIITTLFTASCAEGPLVQRRVPFDEADFKGARGHGTGTVDGQAFIELRDHSIWYGNNTEVAVLPVNAYTTEFVQRRCERGENLADSDARESNYLTMVHADSQGRFSAGGLSPGEYYVTSTVDFHYYYYNDDGSKNWVYKYQYIYSRINVRNGYATHVNQWNQGAGKLY